VIAATEAELNENSHEINILEERKSWKNSKIN